eukprot:GHUV01007976.1.p1 GENE.GHUV01007976.1~~GHUV01007976.1.p1  ORF type:complete len:126 (+),score=12.82 GHUV01007976.1:1231-1608(+)
MAISIPSGSLSQGQVVSSADIPAAGGIPASKKVHESCETHDYTAHSAELYTMNRMQPSVESHYAAADGHQPWTTYLANRLPGFVIALNSKLLPLGSLKNIVHCKAQQQRHRGIGATASLRLSSAT